VELIDELRRWGLLDAGGAAFCGDGHFLYESGDHGDLWLALELLYAQPRALRRAGAELAERLRSHAPEVVCGPLLGGALLGQWVAYALDVAFVYAEPRPGSDYAVPGLLRPSLDGRRVAIVDDAINAGAATLACVPEVRGCGGSVVAVAGLLFRVPGTLETWADLGVAVEYLAGARWNTWPPRDCPLCRAGTPLERPD
jgi:orotate phosphoribosyltransferase